MKGRTSTAVDDADLTRVLLRLIRKRRGKPCPSRADIIAWTGLPRRDVWPFVKSLAERDPPVIELEERLHARAGMRRMRIVGDTWTGWTERKTPSRQDHAVRRRLKREARHGR
jgi:hypothetical protein